MGKRVVAISSTYNAVNRRTTLTRGNGTVTSYAYDPASRLSQLVQNLAVATHDLTLGFAYNPAGQIVSNTRSNDLYSFTGVASGITNSVANGLNQIVTHGGINTSHDARGNMTNDLAGSYGYSSENLLTAGPAGTALAYDPNMRLWQIAGATTARFAYDGFAMVAEYNAANALQYRTVHGGATDEPLVQYDGPGTAGRRFLHADERGSIVAHSDSAGNVTALNHYDEYGMPASGNAGRFQYTGQAWLAEIGLHYYRARMYNPRLGRFMQTDPIGYTAGMNLYAYVRGDPVNRSDPSGLRQICWYVRDGTSRLEGNTIIVELRRQCVEIPDWAVERPGPPIIYDERGGGERSVGPTPIESPDKRRACGPVPRTPPGVSISNIISYSYNSRDLSFLNMTAFLYRNFRSGSGMDFRQINTDTRSRSPFEDFGNFAFGAFTYAAGYSRTSSLVGAGLAQIVAGTSSMRYVFSNFDDPQDQEQIRNGRLFARCMLGE